MVAEKYSRYPCPWGFHEVSVKNKEGPRETAPRNRGIRYVEDQPPGNGDQSLETMLVAKELGQKFGKTLEVF